MSSQKVAERFVRFFCSGNLAKLETVLAESFHLRGPLLETTTRSEYLASLSGTLDPDPEARILASFGSGEKAAVFYVYRGNTIGQLFSCKEGLVYQSTLVFDTKNMA